MNKFEAILRSVLCGMLLGLLAGCATPDGKSEQDDLEGLDTNLVQVVNALTPGDEIDLQVFREPDFSGVFALDEQGNIKHPLLGEVSLAGLDVAGAESHLTGKLAADFLVNPRVMIKVTRSQRYQFVIFGEVKTPGVYPIPPGRSISLLEAIGLAGGFTELASPDRVRVVRKGEDGGETIRVRVENILSGKGKDTDITLQPDDVIVVPQIVF
ncbi:MAG: polysaccharide biosynthesis/export family protein [Kiritimatiellia bacterium]|jgi:protein involved in polysaccharide export with SLBB domain